MKIIKLWRTLKEGVKNFYRNGWLSFATIIVMTVSLYVMSVTILLAFGSNLAVKSLKEEISISVYFNSDVSEARIMEIKKELSSYREIASVEYVSKERALDEFMKAVEKNSIIKETIKEIGGNPLPAALVIKAKSPEKYELIVKAIENSYFRDDINYINYERYKEDIEKINAMTGSIEKAGFAIGVIFVIVAVLIAFNTIRLTIYSHRQEIEIMRLVGASNIYIRLPYVFEGIFYGLASSILTLGLLFITFHFVAPKLLNQIIGQQALIGFFYGYISSIILFLFVGGALLGSVSSAIAVRRYLKI